MTPPGSPTCWRSREQSPAPSAHTWALSTHRHLLPLLRNVSLLTLASCGTSPSSAPSRDAGPADVVAVDGVGASGASTCPDDYEPSDPIDFGRCQLRAALAYANSPAPVSIVLASDPLGASALALGGVTLRAGPESFAVVTVEAETIVVGSDLVGAMYGALEVAERLREVGAGALPLRAPIGGAPGVSLRAANLFLVLPTSTDPSNLPWWFYDPEFWREYLNLMARSRLDVLDLHGMYDIETTLFPNALLYFAISPSFPDVGIDAVLRNVNAAMLRQIVAMASTRGIRVGLMSYRSDTSPRADGTGPALSATDLVTYTREAAADVARGVPGLTWLGFRIGESGQNAAWYESTFVAGVSGTGVKLYTRTWGTTEPEILSVVAAAGSSTLVEVKYNGEQFGAPYVIAGASFAKFADYSYQGYLNPPAPYPFVFQLRTAGTHRIFRFANWERARRTALSFGMSPRVTGFTFEPAHAYSPQRDFYHAPHDVFSPWTFRRDEISYLLLGHLAYDPAAPESRFRAMMAARLGTDALWDALQAESDIVPWIQTAMTCGPDVRHYAAELELGGDVSRWASPAGPGTNCQDHVAFDGFSVALPAEAAADLVGGAATTKLLPTHVAAIVMDDAVRAQAASKVAVGTNVEARDIARECAAVADLGLWFSHKLRSATALAVYQRTAAGDWLAAARSEAALARTAFTQLAADTAYIAPFQENLRMTPLGFSPFHWSKEVGHLADDASAIDAVAQQVAANPPGFSGTLPSASDWLGMPRGTPSGLVSLAPLPADATAASWTLHVVLAAPPSQGTTVRVLWKPFDSETDWTAVNATGASTTWSASVPGGGGGGMFAVEVAGVPGQRWRLPDVLTETPYRVLAP
jgi:hypothetical protein